MHTSQRSLVQSLALDEDSKSTEHDAACLYLAQPGVARRVLVVVYAGQLAKKVEIPAKGDGYHYEYCRCPYCTATIAAERQDQLQKDIQGATAVTEAVVFKGQDQYRSLIGWIDVLIPNMAIIEVKTKPVPISNVVRQLALYQEFTGKPYRFSAGLPCVLATTYRLATAQDAAMLKSNGITHIRLAADFEAFKAKLQATVSDPEVTI
jgi:hypothetical protein